MDAWTTTIECHSTAELLTNSITNNLGANETGKFKSKI